MVDYNPIRTANTQSLDGVWQFKTDPDGIGEAQHWESRFPSDADTMCVPACWNNTAALYDYEGVAYYKTEFYSAAGKVKLTFEGVSNVCTVWLDGEKAAAHTGAYTAFWLYADFAASGMHTLVVRVDSRVNDTDTVPNYSRDWKRYGGIMRSVQLLHLPDFFIDALQIRYTLSDDLTTAVCSIRAQGYGSGTHRYTLLSDGAPLAQGDFAAGENELTFTIEKVRLWHVRAPALYTFTLQSGTDAASLRTGFRKIAVKDGRIEINDRPVYLRGVNRHEEHPEWGHSLPVQLQKRDMDILLSMGCNTVRGAHYPNSRTFLDLCDEAGLLFWSELPLWAYKAVQAENPCVTETILAMGREMVLQNLHHPSIFVWGLHNECETPAQALLALSERMASLYRRLDPSRPITYATDKPMQDICFGCCDFISINRYPGWYGDVVNEWETFFPDFAAYLEKIGQTGKPIVISEFGAGGIYGQRSFEAPKWSENYQADCLEKSIRIFRKHAEVAGMLIWQYSDIRIPTERALTRPRTFNNKGVLDEYRRPKAAFPVVQRLYREIEKEEV